MAVRPYRRSKRGGIPRIDLTARTVQIVFDTRNRPTSETFVEFTLDSCTIQPASGSDLEVLPEGLRDSEAFNVFTNTPLKTAIRGTTEDGDEVFIPSPYTQVPGYFSVIKVKAWQVGVIPHYRVLVVRDNP